MSIRRNFIGLTTSIIALLFFTACSINPPTLTGSPSGTLASETVAVSPEPSKTPIPPTATPIPMAAIVNGEAITLDEFQAELSRYQTAITGTILASDTATIVLNDLVDQTLLAQSAVENGFTVDETMLQSIIENLETQLGSPEVLEDWVSSHGYSENAFQQALLRSVGAAWMRDQIISKVPNTADQVHVVQILLPTSGIANEVYTALQAGTDFLELADTYNPETGGDLGWFPRGYLDEPSLDEAVFALQPGQYTQVIETEIGFHILYVIERDSNHTLQPDAKRKLQIETLQLWLKERRGQSEIKILLP